MNNIKEINDIMKSSYVKIMPLNKSPFPTNVFDTTHTLDIDDRGWGWVVVAGVGGGVGVGGIIHVVWAMLPSVF